MSEVVVSKVTNVAGDYFIDAAQPGSIIQVQAYDYSSVYTNTDIQNKDMLDIFKITWKSNINIVLYFILL